MRDIKRAELALDAYQADGLTTNDDDKIDRVTDLITDLLHYCSRNEIDVNICVDRALMHFSEEREQEEAS